MKRLLGGVHQIIALRSLGPATAPVLAEGTPVAVRQVLSASGRMLALVPDARLPADTWFRVTATGLADVYGGAIVVPTTTFVTTADVAPVYDVEQLVVSFPDADPAGTRDLSKVGVPSVCMSDEGMASGASHSYLTWGEYSRVFSAYRKIHCLFDPSESCSEVVMAVCPEDSAK